MNSEMENKVNQLLANNRLLVGDHKPRSALLEGIETNKLSEGSVLALDNIDDDFIFYGGYKLNNADYHHRKRKERAKRKNRFCVVY